MLLIFIPAFVEMFNEMIVQNVKLEARGLSANFWPYFIQEAMCVYVSMHVRMHACEVNVVSLVFGKRNSRNIHQLKNLEGDTLC